MIIFKKDKESMDINEFYREIGVDAKDVLNRLGSVVLIKKMCIRDRELGFRSGVHRTYIASLEVGKRNISISTLEKIVNALEVTFNEFFNF